ncbi:acyl-CoA thioesterase [Pseudooceanicola aestuarii]|uniref:acyl-CoA thioesterase n=1 Tax=Pseudooceanicola aestuarii TaxID=2697319 RepID=UPI0013D26697|nr:thioesterase family protein [Pseudooceanicola aestuarii]
MAEFISEPMGLKPEWIDFNGHLNMAYYNVLFDTGVDDAFELLGLSERYMRNTAHTTYSAEFRTRYLRELHLGAQVRVTLRILDHGPKSFHFCQTIQHQDGWIAATGEGISLHIDQSGPRVAPYPPEIHEKIAAMAADHATLPVPDWVGAPMGLRK